MGDERPAVEGPGGQPTLTLASDTKGLPSTISEVNPAAFLAWQNRASGLRVIADSAN
jgi:hypothetical protein